MKDDIKIKDLQELKLKAERQILFALRDLEEQTGCYISDVTFHRSEAGGNIYGVIKIDLNL